jgi:hypothetical protein
MQARFGLGGGKAKQTQIEENKQVMRKIMISEMVFEVTMQLHDLQQLRSVIDECDKDGERDWLVFRLEEIEKMLQHHKAGMDDALREDFPTFNVWEDGFLAGFHARCNQDCGTYPRRWERNEAFKRQHPDAPIPPAAGNEGADQTILN